MEGYFSGSWIVRRVGVGENSMCVVEYCMQDVVLNVDASERFTIDALERDGPFARTNCRTWSVRRHGSPG